MSLPKSVSFELLSFFFREEVFPSRIGVFDRERGGRAKAWNADGAWTIVVVGGTVCVDLKHQQVLMEIEEKNNIIFLIFGWHLKWNCW